MDHNADGAATQRPARSFPGGQVRLPRLNAEDRGTGPQLDIVGTAFIGGGTTVIEEPKTGFSGYFTYESLFEEPVEGDEDFVGEDPYAVLKVDRDHDWPAIVAAHRSLVKEFHPDRFVDHPPEVVAQAEIEIKRINLAYSEIRKLRASEGTDRRSGTDRRNGGR